MQTSLPSSSPLARTFLRLLDRSRLVLLAREIGWLRRQRDIDVNQLTLALILASVGPRRKSYAELVTDLYTMGGAPVSRQAICQRLTFAAAQFLISLLGLLLTHILLNEPTERCALPPQLERFPSIRATDSSVVSLPAPLASLLQGSGGSASPAALKAHLTVDVRHGALQAMRITDGVAVDCLGLELQTAPAGTLHLVDKAYSKSPQDLARISMAQQYYVTPLWLNLPLWDRKGSPLDILSVCRAAHDKGSFDIAVRLRPCSSASTAGAMRARLVGFRVPEEVANRRRQRLLKEAHRKGHQPRQSTLEMQHWEVYLTNTHPSELPAPWVRAVYRMRWQVERLFRRWKSVLGMRHPQYKKPQTLMCQTVASLIAVLLLSYLYQRRVALWRPGQREPSYDRMAAALLLQGTLLLRALGSSDSISRRLALLSRVLDAVFRVGHMDKRRRQISSRMALFALS